MNPMNTPSKLSTRVIELVTALRKAPNYADEVQWLASSEFNYTPNDRERLVLCDPIVQREIRLMFPEAGWYTRIRLSMPKEEVTTHNIDDVNVEVYLADNIGNFIRRETLSLTAIPVTLRFALEAEMFHRATGAYNKVNVIRNKETG
jgi:hypothetical protein